MQVDGYLKVTLMVLVLIPMIVAAQSENNQTSTSTFFGISQDILLVGTIQSGSEEDMPGAPDYWMVRVDEVLSGPMPCSNEIRVTTQPATPPPWGTVDEDVKAGDKVWINGRYIPKDSGCEVTLQGSDEYYLRKYPEEIKLLGTAVGFSNMAMPGAGPKWTVKVEEVLSGPQNCSGQLDVITSAALYPAVWGTVEPGIKSGDRLEIFGAYQSSPGIGMCSVTLYGSKGYYIRKVDTGIITNAITDTNVATGTNAVAGTNATNTANETNAMNAANSVDASDVIDDTDTASIINSTDVTSAPNIADITKSLPLQGLDSR